MRVTIDTSEVCQLEADLGRVPDRAVRQVRATVARAALNIKRDLQSEAVGSPSFDRVAASISYDTVVTEDGITAEIGPEYGHPKGHARAQGSLAWIAYEGTATTAPRFPDPIGALERESDAFEHYLADAVIGDFL